MSELKYRKTLDFIDSLADDVTAAEIISKKLSGFVSDTAAVERFLATADIGEKQKLKSIILIHEARRAAEITRSHTRLNVPDVYSVYRDIAGKDAVLDAGDFEALYRAVSGVYLDSQVLDCSPKIVRAVERLLEGGEDKELILQYLSNLADVIFSLKAKTANPASLVPPLPGRSYDPERVKLYGSVFRTLISDRNSILQALCCVTLDREYNDSTVECCAVLPQLMKRRGESPDEPLIIIGAGPVVFRKWLRDLSWHQETGRTVFVFEDGTVAGILSRLYGSDTLSIISSEEFGPFLDVASFDTSSALVFGNSIVSLDSKLSYVDTLKSHISGRHFLYVFNPDSELTDSGSSLKERLLDMFPSKVWIFPSGMDCSTKPDRKLLMCFQYGYVPEKVLAAGITVVRYSQSRLHRSEYYLSVKSSIIQVSREEYISGSCSFRSRFRKGEESLLSRNTGSRTARKIRFTESLTIHYKESENRKLPGLRRVSAHIKTPGSSSVIIEDSVRSSNNVGEDHVEEWLLNIYPYLGKKTNRAVTVRSVLSGMKESFMTPNASLRTFLYLNPQLTHGYPNYSADIVSYLFSSSVGEVPVSRITESSLRSVVQEHERNPDGFSARQMVLFCRHVFAEAADAGLCSVNPAAGIREYDRVHDDEMTNLRNAFAQKFLNPAQRDAILDESEKKAAKGDFRYLATFIRLTTGLDSCIVCALKWSDFTEFPSFPGMHSLLIRRQVESRTGRFRRFTRRELYRKIPCMDRLTDVLLNEMSRRLSEPGMTREILADSVIVRGNALVDGMYHVMPPCELNSFIRKDILKKYSLNPDPLELQTSANTTVELELDFYGRDILKETYRHYAIDGGNGFSLAELNYLMGLRAPDTLSGNYLDYTNDEVQHRLYTNNQQNTLK